jgi:hypothetical protein
MGKSIRWLITSLAHTEGILEGVIATAKIAHSLRR